MHGALGTLRLGLSMALAADYMESACHRKYSTLPVQRLFPKLITLLKSQPCPQSLRDKLAICFCNDCTATIEIYGQVALAHLAQRLSSAILQSEKRMPPAGDAAVGSALIPSSVEARAMKAPKLEVPAQQPDCCSESTSGH